jgi:hypothetical protein
MQTNGCGRWFANGASQQLADWIRQLHAKPQLAAACGLASRDLLLSSASPELVTDRYWELLNRHLPVSKQLNSLTPPRP